MKEHCIDVEDPEKNEAGYYNNLAQTVFFPVYPVIAHQILKKADIDYGLCLDVGSRTGHLSIALATLSDLTVFALDNAEMCRIAKANVKKYRLERRVKPLYGGVNPLSFDDASIDLVVSRESFFSWESLSRGFSECMRVLRPGGMAYIGDGFGNARLRNEILTRMNGSDPVWVEKRLDNYAKCNPHIIRSAISAAGIFGYDFIQDDSGYWVCFTKSW
jgi:ubiquinone/menaquinone biosynthesis C-methylase UbiE